MEDYQSMERIFGQISERNRELARLYGDIAGRIIEEYCNLENSQNNSRKRASAIGKILNGISDPNGRYGEINIIPGDQATSCQAYCICFAFDKWQSEKGFKGIARKTIEYWLSCYAINLGTIIFTYAWDEVDFKENYKNQFDSYAKNAQHTVLVVQISSIGFSIQYLK